MNASTLKALKGSIRKWELIVAGEGKDNGDKNCDLCRLFYSRDCEGCPVAVNYTLCGFTPYGGWMEHHYFDRHRGLPFAARTTKEKALAQAEVDFLRGLLPKRRATKRRS